jgi:predicted dehydrogenase
MNRIRIALIGSGYWGRHHARLYWNRDDTELCAIAGRSERGGKLASTLGARFYQDVDLMLSMERPDLVCVCVPYQQQAAVALHVIRRSFPLFVEKPLATTTTEAAELLREADQRGLFFAINFNHRYARPFQLARETVLAGRVGAPVFAVWRFGGAWDPGHPTGLLIESLCHGFDMLEHLVAPVTSVMCEMSDKTGAGFRSVVLSLGLGDGSVAAAIGSYDSSFEYPLAHYFELNGTLGRILIQDTTRKFTFTPKGSETSETWEAGLFNDQARSFSRMMDLHVDALLTAFRDGRPPPVHARCGWRALQIAEAATLSHRQGRRVAVAAAGATGSR